MATAASPTPIPMGFPHFGDNAVREVIEDNYVSAARGYAGTGQLMFTAHRALDLLNDKFRFCQMHSALEAEVSRPWWRSFGRNQRIRAIIDAHPYNPPFRGTDLTYLDERIRAPRED